MATFDLFLLIRFGHSSCQLNDGRILVMGGFGCTLKKDKTPHSRCNDVIVIASSVNKWEIRNLNTHGEEPSNSNS